MNKLPSQTYLLDSKKPGPSVAIFSGVHGNEKSGVFALKDLAPILKPKIGKIYIVFANPKAIDQNVRMLEKNLNRCFYEGNIGSSWEDARARELMQLLDKCDALLDLHMFYDDDGEPFIICEENAFDIANKLDVNIISSGWNKAEPGGTDGYMFSKGKVGICVECGPISKSKENVDYTKKIIYQFLSYFNMTDSKIEFSTKNKRIIKAEKAINKTSKNFVLQPGFINFQKLQEGALLASDSEKKYLAGVNECIIFPHYSARVGEEAFIIGSEEP